MGSCEFVSGWAGGAVGVIAGHPFDTVKVNQQNQGIGMIKCSKIIFQNHGIKGYFRGLAFPLFTASAINSIFFGVYKVSLNQFIEFKSSKDYKHEETYWEIFVAGCIGGAAQLSLTCPVELVKIKLQTAQSIKKSPGSVNVAFKILKKQGFRGIYQGFGINLIRDVPSAGLYMYAYEHLSDILENIPLFEDGNEAHKIPNTLKIILAGGVAGILSWWSIVPLDVMKSRLQADDPLNPTYKGWMDCCNQIYRVHGIKGFMRGVLPLTLRAFPVNSVTFLGYEWANLICHKLSPQNYI